MNRIFKILLVCIISIFGIIVLGVIGLRIYFSDSRISELAAEYIKSNFGSDTYIRNLNITGFFDIEIEDLELKNESNDSVWLSIDGVKVAAKPFGLLKGNIHISKVSIGNLHVNYDQIPEIKTAAIEETPGNNEMKLPLDFMVDRFELNGLTISGPDAEAKLDILISDILFADKNKFEATYSMQTEFGSLHYSSDTLSIDGRFDISAGGTISSEEDGIQNLEANLIDVRINAGESLYFDKLGMILSTSTNSAENRIGVDDLSFRIGDGEILGLTGYVKLEETPQLSLTAKAAKWNLAGANDYIEDFGIPITLSGDASIDELSIYGSPSYVSLDFGVKLDNVGIDYDGTIYLRGLNGEIYSSGDPGALVFGSSLTVDSVIADNEAGRLFGIYKISSSVEAELSSNDIYFNVDAGIADFFGGKFDIFAFTDSSKVDGKLNIENVDLSEAASGIMANDNIDFSGLANMALAISGRLDSIQSDLSASLSDFRIRLENDSLVIPRQDFTMRGATIINKKTVNSAFVYNLQKDITGEGAILYPLDKTSPDSIIMSYSMNLNNSILPTYLPAALLEALGSVELSGGSVLNGRFSSPADTFMFTGSSKLTIEPTDILISDLQSVLYSLISVSELEVTPRGVSIFSDSGIEDLFNENYSDLDFSGITVQGEVVMLSDTTWRITNMNIVIPTLKSRIDILGDFGFSAGKPFSNLALYFTFDSPEPVEIGSQYFLNGTLKAELRTGTVDSLVEFSGSAEFSDFQFESKGLFKCSGIKGEIPFSGKINLSDSMFVVTGDREGIPDPDYRRARLGNMLANEYGRVQIGIIEADPLYVFDVNIDAAFRDGIFDMPYLTGELLGGNFRGLIRADISDINLMREIPNYNELKYKLDLELSNLDFNQLSYDMGPFEQRADFSADAHFLGSGIVSANEDYSISGSFHITRMGPGVALRVLDVMDPENSNPSIMQTKALLNRKLLGFVDMSYKPKTFSFDLRHGSLYPKLYMDQPFFADVLPLVRVPMPVEYGRIPVKSLLANLKEESW